MRLVATVAATGLWVVLGSASTLARAASPPAPTLGVAEPELAGSFRGLEREGVAEAVVQGLQGLQGFDVRSIGAAKCTDEPECWSQRASSSGSTHLLRVRVTAADRDVDVRLEVYDGSNGVLVTSGEASCEVCADNEVREMITGAAARLRARIEGLVAGDSMLVVEATPKGADVIVDGELMGKTPFRGGVTPGAHEIVVAAEGFHTVELERYAEPGDTQVVEVDLRARDVGTAPDAIRPVGYVGIGLLGAGAALIGTSIAMFVIDGKPVQGSCPPEGSDLNGRCPRMYDTRPGAIATVVTGGASLVTGAVLLALDRTRGRRLRVSIVPGGLHLAGRF